MSENTDTVSPSGDAASPVGHGGDNPAPGSARSPSQSSPDGVSPNAEKSIATAADYLSGLEIGAEERPAYDHFAQTMRREGIPDKHGNQLLGWIGEFEKMTAAPNEAPAHKYNVARTQFAAEDQPYLDAYLNRAAKAGWSQEQVDTAIGWWRGNVYPAVASDRAEGYREAERLDAADEKQRDRALRIEWGLSYDANWRVVNSYFKSLPADERQRLKAEELADGRLAKNDPERIKELLKLATKGKASGKSRDEELTELRHVMKTDRKRWNADELMQARYRTLIAGS